MLARRAGAALIAIAVASAGLIASAGPAYADYIYCPPRGGDCYIVVGTPGGGGGGGGTGGGNTYICHAPDSEGGQVIPCHDPDLGWYSPADSCYWKLVSPQPPAGDPSWGSHYGTGAIYNVWCYGYTSGTGLTWSLNEPPGYGGLPGPLTLAAEAITKMKLTGPEIIIAPLASGSGLVGLPVWLATADNDHTWGPNTKSASVPGLSVTATAQATKISWDMGDGTAPEVCPNTGNTYTAADKDTMPACGHIYTHPSRTRTDGRYTVTGTTTWVVDWTASNGQTGTLTITRESSTTIRIDELQVVTQ